MKNIKQSGRILFLDYMRVLAFSLVILGHKFSKDLLALSQDQSIHVTTRTLCEALYNLSYGGAMGVVVFFLVSGYIITHVLQSENTMEFYLKRIFRIYPLYMFAVIMEIIVRHAYGSPIPTLDVIIPRLLLVGDFFGTPLALGDVEWTLRIEIMFYIFMGLLRKVGILPHGNILTIMLFLLAYALMTAPPFPITNDFHNAYFSTYAPFLFMGVVVYLLEKGLVNCSLAVLCLVAMLFMHLHLIELYNKLWGGYNYAVIGILIFMASWRFRNSMSPNYACLFLSELTYSIYLFHNWIWDFLKYIVARFNLTLINPDAQVFILLLAVCFAAHKLIENNCVRLGKLLLKRFKR